MTDAIDERLAIAVREGKAGQNGHGDAPAFALTDMGNAERLVARHGTDLAYCDNWGKWLVWDEKRWSLDATQEIFRRGKDTVRGIYREVMAENDQDRRERLAKHAVRSESGARVREMIALAQSDPTIAITPAQLDTHPWLVTCQNGTLDLHGATLRPHARCDWITKALSVPYKPDARAPRWDAFLERVMNGNANLIAFLQRAIGYTLTGATGEEVLFFLHGTGRNGKSKFLGAVEHVMGDYAKPTRPETLMAKNRGEIPNDIAALVGARFVPTVEVEDGARLAEGLVKQLTGGDKMSARFLRAEFFEFRPVCKIWLAANHKPVVRGTDTAIWERILLIPFTVTIPPEERDKELAQKLEDEAPGILRWMVEGCLAWQKRGLDPPQEVIAATQEYRDEMDILEQFIADCCEERETAVSTAKQIYDRYSDWCKDNGERQWTQNAFGRRLRERGYEATVFGGTRAWEGLDVKSEPTDL